MNKTITFEVTDELALLCLRNELGFKNFRNLFGMFLLIALVIAFVLWAFGPTARNIAIIILSVIGFLFSIYYWFGYYQIKKNMLLNMAEIPDRWKNYTFKDEFVQIKDIHGVLKFPWKKLEGVVKYKELWQLHFQEANIRLPIFLLDQELETFIDEKAEKQEATISFGAGYRQKIRNQKQALTRKIP